MHTKFFAGAVEASVLLVIDARGRPRQLAALACPACDRQGVVVAIQGLQPMHLSRLEALDLVEALRLGPNHPKLEASLVRPGGRLLLATLKESPGSWVLSFAPDDPGGEFLCSGRDPNLEPPGRGVAFLPPQREAFADAILTELTRDATTLAKA